MATLTLRSGIHELRLGSWHEFPQFVTDYVLAFSAQTIWRGQSSAEWPLETSFDRAVRNSGQEPTERLAQHHLDRFKRATRGRRAPGSRSITSDDEWWTLGQHYGLVTPMLDWTHSPYVALYFAFLDAECLDPGRYRAVWGFYLPNLHQLNSRAAEQASDGKSAPQVQMFDPLVDENARLVNQNGVFTRGTVGVTVDGWVSENNRGDVKPLIKVMIPATGREDCLRHLNHMNINHATLFPDLEGASRHCNHQLTIPAY